MSNIKKWLSPSPKYVKLKDTYTLIKSPYYFEVFLLEHSLQSIDKKVEKKFPQWPPDPVEIDNSLKGPFILTFSNKRREKKEEILEWVGKLREKILNHPHSYILEIKKTEILIFASTKESLYWAIATLAQIMEIKKVVKKIPQLLIIDYPSYSFRGIQLDLSRGRVLKVNSLKRWIRWIAGMKGNFLSLYIEPHVIYWKRHPALRKNHDVLLREEIIELDRYAKKYNIQLIPGFQTLSHMERILSIPEYSHLSERNDEFITICPVLSETKKLLQDFFEELCPLFSSKYFNAGFDECLPFEKSLKIHPEKTPVDIFLTHLQWVYRQLKKSGKQMMIYADTLWRNYPFVLKEHPEKEKEIPRDVILLNWQYEPQESYPSMECFSKMGFKQIILSGALDSRRIFPRIYRANEGLRKWLKNIKNKPGILGVVSTSWGNHYHRNPPENSLYSLMYALEAGWQGNSSNEGDFQRKYSFLFLKCKNQEAINYGKHLLHLLGSAEDKGPSLKFYVPWRNNYRRITHYFLFWLGEDPSHRFDGKKPRVFSLEGDTLGKINISDCKQLQLLGEESLQLIEKIKNKGNSFLLKRMAYSAEEIKVLGWKLKLRNETQKIRKEFMLSPLKRRIKKIELENFLSEYRIFYKELQLLQQKFINLWKETCKEKNLDIHICCFEQLLYYHENIIKEIEYLISTWDKKMDFYNM